MTLEDLLDAWRVNHVVTLELLALCPDEAMELKPGKGKTIRSNWVHIIGVRRQWAEEKLPTLAAEIPKLDWKTASRAEIEENLARTHELMEAVFIKRSEATKATRFTDIKYFAYVIAHEAHHRSQIEIALRIGGFEMEDLAMFSLWDWSKK